VKFLEASFQAIDRLRLPLQSEEVPSFCLFEVMLPLKGSCFCFIAKCIGQPNTFALEALEDAEWLYEVPCMADPKAEQTDVVTVRRILGESMASSSQELLLLTA